MRHVTRIELLLHPRRLEDLGGPDGDEGGRAQKLASRDELSDEPQPVSGNTPFFKGGHWEAGHVNQFGIADWSSVAGSGGGL